MASGDSGAARHVEHQVFNLFDDFTVNPLTMIPAQLAEAQARSYVAPKNDFGGRLLIQKSPVGCASVRQKEDSQCCAENSRGERFYPRSDFFHGPLESVHESFS